MTLQKKSLYLTVLLIVSVSASCSKEREYEFIVTNNTEYFINKMEFGINDKTVISVNPNSTSERFIRPIKNPVFALSEPLLSVIISAYSDSTTSYENNIGQVIFIGKLNKKKINNVNIDLQPNTTPGEYIFRIKLEE